MDYSEVIKRKEKEREVLNNLNSKVNSQKAYAKLLIERIPSNKMQAVILFLEGASISDDE